MKTFTVVDDVACASALKGSGGRHVLRCKACSDEDLRRMTTRVRCQGVVTAALCCRSGR
jgi:hypothetical protein